MVITNEEKKLLAYIGAAINSEYLTEEQVAKHRRQLKRMRHEIRLRKIRAASFIYQERSMCHG